VAADKDPGLQTGDTGSDERGPRTVGERK